LFKKKGLNTLDAIVNKLRQEGLLDAEAADQVVRALESGVLLDDALRTPKSAAEDKILRFLAGYFDVPYIDLEHDGEKFAPSKEMLGKLPARILVDHRLMPLANFNGFGPDELTIVTSRVFDQHGLDELRLATGMEIHPALAPAAEVDRFTKKYLGVGADTLQSMGVSDDDNVTVIDESHEDDLDLSNAAQDASIIKFVNQVTGRSIGASSHRRSRRTI